VYFPVPIPTGVNVFTLTSLMRLIGTFITNVYKRFVLFFTKKTRLQTIFI